MAAGTHADMLEHVGPWTERDYRAIKPQLYAQAGIPYYLRVELGEAGPGAVSYRLKRNHYAEVAYADPVHPLVLTEPIAVTLDLAALATATRSPS